jgi:hypothetical protein
VRRPALVLAGALALVLPATAAQAAGGPTPLSLSFDEPVVTTSVDGLGRGCPAFTGVLEEQRHLDIDGWIKPDGTAHARTLVTALVTLTPDDPEAPAYVGRYTQHQTGQFTAAGDDERVVTTTMHGALRGSDGSSYRISEVVHLSFDAHGAVRSSFDRMHCGG